MIYRNKSIHMRNMSKEVFYDIHFSKTIIKGNSIMCHVDADIASDIATVMVHKESRKFSSFDEYKNSEIPKIDIQVTIQIDNNKKIYTVNENLLMYIYNYKFDEYYLESKYVESEYEISDWAISSPGSSSSSSSVTSIDSEYYV